MEQYIVSARKYRPSTFHSVVGQKSLTETLKNAIASDRLAHAYLFCGSRGVGKTSCARIFAKTINCSSRTPQGEACNECDSCRQFNENRSMNIIELDAASHNGVDDIKGLIEQVGVAPSRGRYRVFIIDEVHMLSPSAFNAFLKTLEEPPAHAIFILATTEKHKIIPTILSRCQIYDFNRIGIADMVDHLSYVASQEGITVDRRALHVIASKADGAMRDALSIFDQVAASSRGNITYASTIENLNVLDRSYYGRLLDAMMTTDVPAALLVYKEVRDKGFDSQFFINGMGQYMRDLMLAHSPDTASMIECGEDERAEMVARAAKCKPGMIFKAMDLCNEADLNYRVAANKQFLIELTLIKLCQLFSPSPNSGDGEGRLKPIAAPARRVARKPAPVAQAPAGQTAAQPEPARAPAGPAPAVAPRVAPAAPGAAPRRPRTTLRTPGLSLSGTSHEAEAPAARVERHRDSAFTDAALQQAWDAFIAAHPREVVLVNTMRSSRPVNSLATAYTVTVENDIQVATINENMQRLLGHLRDALNNDSVTLEVRVNTGEASPVTWNEREVLAHIIEHSADAAAFISEFKLTLL